MRVSRMQAVLRELLQGLRNTLWETLSEVWGRSPNNMVPIATSRTVLINRRPFSHLLPLPRYPGNTITTAKYTLLTFLPKNLFEQFRRLANFYFLCLAIIHVTINSPVSPLTSVLPLVLVICVTAVKQGYEDWLRHREDNKVNNSPSRVLLEGEVKEVPRREISVGDIVQVRRDEEFPCDLLLLTCHDVIEAKSDVTTGSCDVTTANLDGETNLKTFVCPVETRELRTHQQLWKLTATVQCQLPHANLYDFKGKMEVYRGSGLPTTASLNTDNLLPRGARLKNTSTVYGVAIYTGEETKMALNSKMTSNKFSIVEKSMNSFLAFFMVLLLVEVTVCTTLKYYLYGNDVSKIQKFWGTSFLKWDDELSGPGELEGVRVNTSDVNEELGQVQYLFTDKTGTLTENTMHLRQCSVEGVKYTDVGGDLHVLDEETNTTTPLRDLKDEVERFLVTLALCHTVKVAVPSPTMSKGGKKRSTNDTHLHTLTPDYQASSPDEKALVEACARYGIVFRGVKSNSITLDVRGQTRSYKRLQVLQFDPDRKCMSVVVREEASGRIWLLTKGAESSVLRRCADAAHQQPLHDTTLAHIDDYALLGLRTLVVARKELDYKHYQVFASQLSKARQVVEGREAAVREVTERMEAELRLLGATGVEDLLQEGVQETLEALRAAGIKVWVLTGDKVETAVNIAYSCGHFKRFMTVLSLTSLHDLHQAESVLQMCWEVSEEEGSYGLVVDGGSLVLLMEHHKRDFYDLCCRCWSVVCCRMSPRQKAEMVRLVKTAKERPRCAAIGDGANDVSMIQEAHVGIGIMGKEGRQAVTCADFGISRFQFLQKVLLVHGHWSYVRVAVFIQFSFYKNVVFNTPMVFYAVWSAFSTQSVYDGLLLTMYNITCTSLPVLVYSLVEQNLPSSVLLTRPHLYQLNANNAYMSWRVFFQWNLFDSIRDQLLHRGVRGGSGSRLLGPVSHVCHLLRPSCAVIEQLSTTGDDCGAGPWSVVHYNDKTSTYIQLHIKLITTDDDDYCPPLALASLTLQPLNVSLFLRRPQTQLVNSLVVYVRISISSSL
ncbi:phospholipid-transporting ATPase IF-like isoform X2 [Homarus americanus]|uniref:phospholipid-transporting ATPase IF-like isoform X2 n=1 Tax=Homarus americanus TaxID=6706 RepID=UPI001C46A850|nr:phospholipid-transporting ATPase IF-like isoform X2 [Homarus americanus]